MPKSETSLNELLYDVKRIAKHREKLSEEKITAIYQTLSKDLKAFLADEYIKYSDEEGRLFVSYLDAQNHKARFLQEIANKVDSIVPQLKEEILGYADETFTKSYEGMIGALQKADEAGKIAEVGADLAVNPNVLKQAVNNNIAKLTLPAVMEKYRAEIVYQIQQELNIGLMRGDRYETMAKRIVERVGVSEGKAKNIVRTETHRNIETGFMDCAEHIQDGMDGSDYIYAATWRTMGDERVRPQVRRKTKSGWKTSWSKNGANHIKMEGVTVKVGDLFNLGGGVKAKCPSQSGVAAHDCNCRCYLEYNLMTVKEFEKATGKAYDYGKAHYDRMLKNEPKITSDLQEVVGETGGELAGLEFRLKTEESYKRKLGKEMTELGIPEEEAVKNMRDVVRYTSLSSKETLANDYYDITEGLSKKGYSVVRVKNTFEKDAPYKGINAILRNENGVEFELQFHTPQSFELKNGILHELYEKERLTTTSATEKIALQKQMKEISDSIVFPDGVESIKSFNKLK